MAYIHGMDTYTREYPLLSLCGLNCGLCPRYHTRGTSSFITKQRQLADFEKVREIGLEAYQAELGEKMGILQCLLDGFDDGRRKNFYCPAINLLELKDIKEVIAHIDIGISPDATPKEKTAVAVRLFGEMADT